MSAIQAKKEGGTIAVKAGFDSSQAMTPMKTRNIASPMFLDDHGSVALTRKYRTPHARGGSVDIQQGSPRQDPARALIRKLKLEKMERQKVIQAKQLIQLREMEAKTEEQTKRYDEMQRKLQIEKIQKH